MSEDIKEAAVEAALCPRQRAEGNVTVVERLNRREWFRQMVVGQEGGDAQRHTQETSARRVARLMQKRLKHTQTNPFCKRTRPSTQHHDRGAPQLRLPDSATYSVVNDASHAPHTQHTQGDTESSSGVVNTTAQACGYCTVNKVTRLRARPMPQHVPTRHPTPPEESIVGVSRRSGHQGISLVCIVQKGDLEQRESCAVG